MDERIEYQDLDRWLATSPPVPVDDDEPDPPRAPDALDEVARALRAQPGVE